ncbi:hypothetical protein Tco_0439265, partial [Tanacetum coccineum]
DLIKKRKKKEERFPIGTTLVEMMDERGVIDMRVDNKEGAKVMRKHGQYYSQRPVQVACNLKLEDLPLKINLPMDLITSLNMITKDVVKFSLWWSSDDLDC